MTPEPHVLSTQGHVVESYQAKGCCPFDVTRPLEAACPIEKCPAFSRAHNACGFTVLPSRIPGTLDLQDISFLMQVEVDEVQESLRKELDVVHSLMFLLRESPVLSLVPQDSCASCGMPLDLAQHMDLDTCKRARRLWYRIRRDPLIKALRGAVPPRVLNPVDTGIFTRDRFWALILSYGTWGRNARSLKSLFALSQKDAQFVDQFFSPS